MPLAINIFFNFVYAVWHWIMWWLPVLCKLKQCMSNLPLTKSILYENKYIYLFLSRKLKKSIGRTPPLHLNNFYNHVHILILRWNFFCLLFKPITMFGYCYCRMIGLHLRHQKVYRWDVRWRWLVKTPAHHLNTHQWKIHHLPIEPTQAWLEAW